jgi:hypothetical protein
VIKVKTKYAEAIWKSEEFCWFSDNKDFEEMLNDYAPDLDDYAYDTPFLIGGFDKIALDLVKEIFGSDLEVVSFEPPEPPEEKPGVVY